LILGAGPLTSKLTSEGYIEAIAVGKIFAGAFLVLTWGAVVAERVSRFLGPQLTSMLGVAIALLGFTVSAFLPHQAETYIVLVAYGLIGWGGCMSFANSFDFAMLFPGHFSIAGCMMAGLFNLLGCVFMLINIGSLCFQTFVGAYLGMIALMLGDKAYIGQPRLHWRSPCTFSAYRAHAGCLLNTRFLLLALHFGLSTTFSTYSLGLVTKPVYKFGEQHCWYASWAVPIATNTVVLLSCPSSFLNNRTGFGIASLGLAISYITSTLLCLFTDSTRAAFSILSLLNLVQAVQYTMQLAFLRYALPHGAFTTGLAAVFCVQGCFNFLSWPVLEEAIGANYTSAF